MANEVKYKPQIWGEPIEGERLSTNGHYTGERVSSPLQDALVEMTAHYTEEGIVRNGTITPDVLNDIEQEGGAMIKFEVMGAGYFVAPLGTTWRKFVAKNGLFEDTEHYCSACGESSVKFAINSDDKVVMVCGSCDNTTYTLGFDSPGTGENYDVISADEKIRTDGYYCY